MANDPCHLHVYVHVHVHAHVYTNKQFNISTFYCPQILVKGQQQCMFNVCALYCACNRLINARRMRTRVTVVCLSVCLFVCLSVCYRSTASVKHLCNKMNVPANFSPNSKGFQLRDFAKKLSLTSYSLFFVFSIARSAIFQFPV